MSDLVLADIGKSFGPLHVLQDIKLEVKPGEFVAFIGPSGSGKSTLLRIIAGLDSPTTGVMRIGGVDVSGLPLDQRGVAMVFQSYALYPNMSVFGNIAFPLQMQKLPAEAIRRKVTETAEKLQLSAYLDRRPAMLSGGQRQRVAIGRAMVREPKIFLFDEPLSNLDAELRVKMRLEIALLKQQFPGTTMIYVTHDQVEAMTLAERIVVLRGGRIEAVGDPLALYDAPPNRFVAGFIGSPKMNFLEGPAAAAVGGNSIGLRPEHLHLGTAGEGWPARILHIERLGSDTYVHTRLDDGQMLLARVAASTDLRQGATIRLVPDANQIHRFDIAGNALT